VHAAGDCPPPVIRVSSGPKTPTGRRNQKKRKEKKKKKRKKRKKTKRKKPLEAEGGREEEEGRSRAGWVGGGREDISAGGVFDPAPRICADSEMSPRCQWGGALLGSCLVGGISGAITELVKVL